MHVREQLKRIIREAIGDNEIGGRHHLDDGGEAMTHAVHDLKMAMRNAMVVFADNQPSTRQGDVSAISAQFDEKLEMLVDWAFSAINEG